MTEEKNQMESTKTSFFFPGNKMISWIAVFVIITGIIFLFPIPTENVTVELCLEQVIDGTEISVSLENEDGSVRGEEAYVYAGLAEFRFDPAYFSCESISISGLPEEAVLSSVRLYSGSYDVSRDKVIANIQIDRNAESGALILNKDTCEEIYEATKSNWSIKWKLFLLFLVVYLLAVSYRCGKKTKYAKICLWVILGMYIVVGIIGNRYDFLERYNSVSNIAEVTENRMLKETTETEFHITEDDFNSITIPVVTNDETVYEDFGVRIIRSEDGAEIYTRLFTAEYIKQNSEISFSLSDELETVSQGTYTLVMEPMDPDVESTVLFQFDTEGNLGISVVYGPGSRNVILMIVCLIGIFLLMLLAFQYKDFKLSNDTAIIIIYGAVALYAIVQIVYYGTYVGNTPDQLAHASYVVYLVENRTLIPDFASMPIYNFVDLVPVVNEGTVNYLGHPPLYYWILALVQMVAGGEQLHLNLLRGVSAGIGMLGVWIFFMIGYRNIPREHPYIHLVYAASCISVPFITYGFSGINNDTLSFLGAALAFSGILRFEKKNRNRLTYVLLAAGMFFAVFSKLTAGLVLLIAYIVYFIYVCTKEKNLRCVLNRTCLVVIPFVIVIAAYFSVLYLKMGTIQPSLSNMGVSYYESSDFYTEFSSREVYTLREYFIHYWTSFLVTWSDIISHVNIHKPSAWYGWNRFIYLILLICPIFSVKKKYSGHVFCLSVYAGMLIAMLMQFYNAYRNFYFYSGHSGGYQSRYYLCWVPMLAFVFSYHFRSAEENSIEGDVKKKRIRLLALISVLLLFYGSFIYTLLVYTD